MSDPKTELISVPKRYSKPLAPTMGRKVIRRCMGRAGQELGTLIVGYDGTPEDAIAKAKELTEHADGMYPDIMHGESQNGATDLLGQPKYRISPNFKIVIDVRDLMVAV